MKKISFASTAKTAAAILICIVSVVSVHAQSAGQFSLSWSTIDGGGGTSSGGQFTLNGIVGQPDTGAPLSGGQFSLTGGFWSFLSVVQTPGAPLLKIKLLSNGMAVVSWPVSVTGFQVEETGNLATGNWNTPPQSVIDTATEHTVTVPANGLMKVFRLKQ